jgi:hypothetical protein
MPNACVLTKQIFFQVNPQFAMKWLGWKPCKMFVALSLGE